MLAVVKEKIGPGYVLKEVEVPVIQEDEVLIKVDSVGVCGSDIPIFKGVRQVPIPLIPGHEFSGVIVETGSKVLKFKKGDRVTPGLVRNCGKCLSCREGLESLCDNLLETGIHLDGAFTEYVAVPESTLHIMPDNMSFVEGASVDPVASAYRPVRKAGVSPEDVVVIFGPGPIGLYALQIAKAYGAKKAIMVGTRESRLKLARELGADETVNIGEKKEDPVKKIWEFTQGVMADVIIEATGVASSVEMCIQSLKKNGRLSLAGIFHEPVTISQLDQVVRKELNVQGSICYTWKDFQSCIDLISAGKVKVDRIVTHELPLKDIAKALELIDKRQAMKVILHP